MNDPAPARRFSRNLPPPVRRPRPTVPPADPADQSTRDKALAALRAYISSRRNNPERDFPQLWKGLFKCMRDCECSRAQELLAHELSRLIMPLAPATALRFWQAFWSAMCAEWEGIDDARVKRFKVLVRRQVEGGFRYAQLHGWEEGLVGKMMGVVEEGPLHVRQKVPEGLRWEVGDVWVDALETVRGRGEMLPDGVLRPFEKLGMEGNERPWRGKAREVLLDGRLQAWGEGREWGDEEGEVLEERKAAEGWEGGAYDDEEEEFKGFD